MKEVIAHVGTVELINHNVYQVTLKVENLTFIAGQYLMIQLPSGESVPYSIGSAPHELPELTLYILVNDTASLAFKVIEFLQSQTDISIMVPGGDCHLASRSIGLCPFGGESLDSSLETVLLIAGGTGFSQMKSMYDSLVKQKFKGHIALYWGLRTPADIFLQEWLDHAQAEHTFTLEVIVNEPDDTWQGRSGWLYEAIQADHPDLSQSVAFISGSVGMVYGTMDQLVANGLTQERCFSDVFAYAPRPESPQL